MKKRNKKIPILILVLFLSIPFLLTSCSGVNKTNNNQDSRYTYFDPYISSNTDEVNNFCNIYKTRFLDFEKFNDFFYKTFSKEKDFYLNSNKKISWNDKTLEIISIYFFNLLNKNIETTLPDWISVKKEYKDDFSETPFIFDEKEKKYFCKKTFRINIRPNFYSQEITNEVYYIFSDYYSIIR